MYKPSTNVQQRLKDVVKVEKGGKCEVNPECSSPRNKGFSGNFNKNARGRVNLQARK